MKPFTLESPSFVRSFASLRSYTPRILIPSSARISFKKFTIISLNCSMPSARHSTTSTSSYLSITKPGKKSASPKIIRQEEVSTVVLRYSHAFFTRIFKNASSISWSGFLVIMRIRIFEFWLINPFPIGYPSKSCTVTTSPFLNRPVMVSISLSKIHAPPALMVRPSPFFNVTIALMSALLI